MSNAVHSYGSTIGVGPVGGAYVAIAEVIDIVGPDVKVAPTKVTHLTSPNAFHEKIPGFGDGGEVTFKMNFFKTSFNSLYGMLRVMKGWEITFAEGSLMEFAGFITGIKPSANEENQLMQDVTIEVTGKPTFTPAP